jgi:hypothetical protein
MTRICLAATALLMFVVIDNVFLDIVMQQPDQDGRLQAQWPD